MIHTLVCELIADFTCCEKHTYSGGAINSMEFTASTYVRSVLILRFGLRQYSVENVQGENTYKIDVTAMNQQSL